MAKGKIVNTTPKGKHSLLRQFRRLWSKGTFSAGRNAEKRAKPSGWPRAYMLADRRLRQRKGTL